MFRYHMHPIQARVLGMLAELLNRITIHFGGPSRLLRTVMEPFSGESVNLRPCPFCSI